MPSVVTTQRDFSAGEVDVAAKRDETNPLIKAGARQASNGRILNSKGWQNRPGRRALFKETGRVEEIQLGTSKFLLCFGAGTLRVYSSTGATQHFTESGRPWSNTTAKSVVFAIFNKMIVVCFTSGVPRVLTWDGATTFTAADYAETISPGGQKRTPFYRISPPDITLLPSATSGVVNITFSAAVLVNGMIGTRLRFCGRQLQIKTVTNTLTGTATVVEPLPPGQALTLGATVGQFNIGDVVKGGTSSATGIVTISPTIQTMSVSPFSGTFAVGNAVTGGTSGATGIVTAATNVGGIQWILTVALSTGTLFQAGETITGPSGSGTISGVSTNAMTVQVLQQSTTGIIRVFAAAELVVGPSGSATISAVATVVPQAVAVWDDEVFNSYRGYPASVFSDQGRLGFTNFPAVPRGIAWSAFGLPNDLYVDATVSTAAMFELAPENAQVYFVQGGQDGSELVFCSNALWRIPISASNPLKPGSVGFEAISADGCANVQPRKAGEQLFYLSAGLTRVMAVIATGANTHPFSTRDISELRTHLFNAPIAIAIPTTDGTFPERYMYVVNADGTVAVGKFTTVNGAININDVVGWLPWSGGGTVKWMAALGADVIFTTSYAPNAIGAVSIVEILDDTYYLDAAQLYNTQPAGLPIPGGKGPLWWIAGGTVDLMDGGTRMMGTYTIDANGFLVPQNNAGENLNSVTLVAGQAWTATLEPFIPAVQGGQDVGQRMWKRRIQRFQVYVLNSSGFVMERLYSDQSGPLLPAPGTVMKQRRISTWNLDEDPTQPPTLREQSYLDRPIGRSHDPREAIVKDTPGPLTIAEIATEVTT